VKSLRRFTCPGEKSPLLELRHQIKDQEIHKILPTRNIKWRIVRGRSLVSRHLGTLCLLMDWYQVILAYPGWANSRAALVRHFMFSRHHLILWLNLWVFYFNNFSIRKKMRDSHRLFLRSLMSKQFLSEKETKALYQKACRVFGGKSKRLYVTSNLHSQTCKLMIIERFF